MPAVDDHVTNASHASIVAASCRPAARHRPAASLVRSPDADRFGRTRVLAEPVARRGRRPASHRDPAVGHGPRDRSRRAPRGHAREAVVATMVVLRDPGEAYLLRHTGGADAIRGSSASTPRRSRSIERSADLPGGKTGPVASPPTRTAPSTSRSVATCTASTPDLRWCARRELPRDRPYNSFVILPDGHLALKDFGGVLPAGIERPTTSRASCWCSNRRRSRSSRGCTLPGASIARLSADGDDVYVVGAHAPVPRRAGTARTSRSTRTSGRGTARSTARRTAGTP